MARKTSNGMIAKAWFPRTAFNLHNQAVLRARYHGDDRRNDTIGPRTGFVVEFLGEKARIQLDAALTQGVVAIRASTMEALVAETDETKQLLRTYLDAHFRNSQWHGNGHRRVSNAAAQSLYYDDVAETGGVTSLIYSKFGHRGGGGFVDFLLLHIKGGILTPRVKDWLRIENLEETGRSFGRPMNNGYYPISNSDIFMVKSKDGQKLFQLRRPRSGGKTVLLATLLKSLPVTASLAGVGTILAARGARLERHFDATFSRKKADGRFTPERTV